MLPEIRVKVVRHSDQVYDTVGDYRFKNGVLHFSISDLRNDDYSILVLIHELLEWHICHKLGIKIEDVDRFDMNFECERARGVHSKDAEPGDDPRAPYGFAHKKATKLEKYAAKLLKIPWSIYSKRVNSL